MDFGPISFLVLFAYMGLFLWFIFRWYKKLVPERVIDELMRAPSEDEEPASLVSTPVAALAPFPDMHIWHLGDLKKLPASPGLVRAAQIHATKLVAKVVSHLLLLLLGTLCVLLGEQGQDVVLAGNELDMPWGLYAFGLVTVVLRWLAFGDLDRIPGFSQMTLVVLGLYYLGQVCIAVALILMVSVTTALGTFLFLVVLVGAVLLGVWGEAWLQNRWIPVRQQPWPWLLLRIFGNQSRTQLFTSRLFSAWQAWGSVYTIGSVDQYSARHEGRGQFYLVLGAGAAFFGGLLVLLASFFVLPGLLQLLSLAAALGAAYGIVLWFHKALRWQFGRQFHSHLQDFEAEVTKAQRKHWRTRRYGNPNIYCSGNIWKPAVMRLLHHAQVVTVDLRGFTSHNAGTTWETNMLFNHYPLRQVVFLIDDETDVAYTESVFRTAWQQLSADSPNARGLERIHLYLLADVGWVEARGILQMMEGSCQGLLDTWLTQHPELAQNIKDGTLGEELQEHIGIDRLQARQQKRGLYAALLLLPISLLVVSWKSLAEVWPMGRWMGWGLLLLSVFVLSQTISRKLKGK